MATCTALRERKDMVFTTRPYTGKGGGGGLRGYKVQGGKDREEWRRGMERLAAEGEVDVHKLKCPASRDDLKRRHRRDIFFCPKDVRTQDQVPQPQR